MSHQQEELERIVVAMATGQAIEVHGALQEDSGRPYGVPISITPYPGRDNGVLVMLDNGVSVYLNPSFHTFGARGIPGTSKSRLAGAAAEATGTPVKTIKLELSGEIRELLALILEADQVEVK